MTNLPPPVPVALFKIDHRDRPREIREADVNRQNCLAQLWRIAKKPLVPRLDVGKPLRTMANLVKGK